MIGTDGSLTELPSLGGPGQPTERAQHHRQRDQITREPPFLARHRHMFANSQSPRVPQGTSTSASPCGGMLDESELQESIAIMGPPLAHTREQPRYERHGGGEKDDETSSEEEEASYNMMAMKALTPPEPPEVDTADAHDNVTTRGHGGGHTQARGRWNTRRASDAADVADAATTDSDSGSGTETQATATEAETHGVVDATSLEAVVLVPETQYSQLPSQTPLLCAPPPVARGVSAESAAAATAAPQPPPPPQPPPLAAALPAAAGCPPLACRRPAAPARAT